jgi:two-component system, OmpR family, osmolarity sensor histidine kinase EnvZ
MSIKPVPTLYDRFNEVLERYAPQGLYRRAMAILIIPVILLQLIVASFILLRYWDNETLVLAHTLTNEIGLLINSYEHSDRSDAALETIKKTAVDQLHMDFDYARGKELPANFKPNVTIIDQRLQQFLNSDSAHKYWVESATAKGKVQINVEVEKDLVFQARVNSDRGRVVGAPLLVAFMLASTTALLSIAVIFLRNQINPILDLTQAAQAFGRGRDADSFHPQGATEVRLAGEAFIDMKRRIARHVDQRTTMLAGVSHDLRTILTRFKLGLAVLGDQQRLKPLQDDVAEMQHMLEDYMAFVRGDGGEQASAISVPDAVQSVVKSFASEKSKFKLVAVPAQILQLKPNAFRRLLTNIIANALRHGQHIEITGAIVGDRMWIYVDDNGPGIPAPLREDAFRPFVRLDPSRNLDKTGTGLGLAIALDIALAHGGDIELQDSPLGGLRAAIRIPI